jgi:hypothetical protein
MPNVPESRQPTEQLTPEILQALAQKVYYLLKQELRLERERLGQSRSSTNDYTRRH